MRALRYSRASDSPRASTCSTCPTFQDLLSRTPGPPRIQTRAHVRSMDPYPGSISFLLIPERRPPPSPVLVSLAAAALGPLLVAPAGAIRPRLSHRYSRGLLGARGKMRQVVVRSRSPGTREIRLLFSPPFVHPSVRPVRPPVRPLGSDRAPFIRAGILMRACVGRVCMRARAYSGAPRCPQAPCARRGRGRYIIFAR